MILARDKLVTRFAPSPNGRLHLGHALSALIGHEIARAFGGRFLLRIEDIDPSRSRAEHLDAIERDLAWLGLTWETPVLRQSQRMSQYAAAAERLNALGLLYPCFASRREIEASADPRHIDPDGAPIYPSLWRGRSREDVAAMLSRGEPPAMRLDVEAAMRRLASVRGEPVELTFGDVDKGYEFENWRRTADPRRWGDVVVQRKEVPTSYHLAVVVDDAEQGVTLVTRGMDLFAATDIHRLLQSLLELPEPLYLHHPLLLDGSGSKLAKSADSLSLDALRRGGATPADIRREAGLGALLASYLARIERWLIHRGG